MEKKSLTWYNQAIQEKTGEKKLIRVIFESTDKKPGTEDDYVIKFIAENGGVDNDSVKICNWIELIIRTLRAHGYIDKEIMEFIDVEKLYDALFENTKENNVQY
ncbi:MAG: hypothetical protein GY754_29340 [bacterium]|nr:hypothetical protein [bacterium]